MNIYTQNDTVSVNLGRITVAWLTDRKVIRIVLSATGECLREDPTRDDFDLHEFKMEVKKYEKLMNLK